MNSLIAALHNLIPIHDPRALVIVGFGLGTMSTLGFMYAYYAIIDWLEGPPQRKTWPMPKSLEKTK